MKRSLKPILYRISLLILIFLSLLVFFRAMFNNTSLNHLETMVEPWLLLILKLAGALLLVCMFLFADKLLGKLPQKQQLILTGAGAALFMLLQYFLLFSLRPVLRYDHLQVFDGAWEIIHTGNLSLTASNGYFGHYPFNIAITLFHSGILRALSFLGITEGNSMPALQCVYVFLIDLGIFFAWQITRMLYSPRHAALLMILCFCNPVLYFCAAGCYTTTLMLPLLMGVLLFMTLFYKEQRPLPKLLLGFCFGFFLIFGTILRATVLIAAFAMGIFLLIRERSDASSVRNKKRAVSLFLAVILGCTAAGGSFFLLKKSCVSESYENSQMPPVYYLMFAANPETRGTYSEEDFELISSYDTLEKKEEASFKLLKERLHTMGLPGILSLGEHKLALTWSDGTEDYKDFVTTSRNYSDLHSAVAGEHSDLVALYFHMFHIAALGLFLLSLLRALTQRCDSLRYVLYLTLLGGMIFHMLWESYYIYSFGFLLLILIPGADTLCRLSETGFCGRPLKVCSLCSVFLLLLTALPAGNALRKTAYEHREFSVSQDMNAGEQLPLLSGERITQTFHADRPFNRIACKVENPLGAENHSVYELELLAEDGTVITGRKINSWEVPDKDYCYMETPLTDPDPSKTYTIRITPVETDSENHLTFMCYHSGNYDLYSDGRMHGPNSRETTDLTFCVFQTVTSNFFHCR